MSMSDTIDSATLQTGISVSDFCTINDSSYSIPFFNVSIIGKLVVGTLCISTSSTFGTSQINPITIKPGYRPSSTVNSFCAYSTDAYEVDNGVGYLYIATNGGLYLKTSESTSKYAKIQLIYKVS